jgi:hypothetical protein
VKLTAGDGYVTEKDVDANGEITLYYTDLAQGVNKVEAVFVREDGEITLTMPDAVFEYDGRPHRVGISGIASGDEVAYLYRVGDAGFVTSYGNPYFTDVNQVVADGFPGASGDEILVYAIVTRGAVSARASATLTITPRQITVKPADRQKVYDGKALTANNAVISAGTLVQGHSLDLSSAVFGGSRTKVGSAPSTVSGVSVAGTNPANYGISYQAGRLIVTKATDEDENDDDKDDEDKDDEDEDQGDGDDARTPSIRPGAGETSQGAVTATDGGVTTDEGIKPTESGIHVPQPVSPTTDGGVVAPPGRDGGFPWWGYVMIVVACAAALWLLLAYRRRRKKADEGTDEAYPG